VIAYAILGCGTCCYCQHGVPTRCQNKKFVQGGFQEYSVYDERLLFPCPEGIDSVTASLLSDAIGVPLRGLRRLPPEKSDKVCVWGMGPLGLLQVMFLKAAGVQTIIALDTIDQRLQKAGKLGADFVVNPQKGEAVAKVRELCSGIGADKAYTYVRNAKATETVFHSTREGAAICTFVGLDGKYDLQEWVERTLIWSFYFTPDEFQENLDFIARHRIDVKQVVSDVIPLSRINEAFQKRFDQQDTSLKIVISMP